MLWVVSAVKAFPNELAQETARELVVEFMSMLPTIIMTSLVMSVIAWCIFKLRVLVRKVRGIIKLRIWQRVESRKERN